MNIELKQAAQQALKALENSQPHPSNPFIGLTKQDFIDHEETIRQLRTALAQQPATATACGIPGMAKTTCPYCDQEFAFEHEQLATGEPVVGVGQSKNRHWSAALADDLVASGDAMRQSIAALSQQPDNTACKSVQKRLAAQQPAQATQAEVTDAAIDAATRHIYHNGRPTSKEYRVGIARAILALRPQQSGLTGCNCRWDGDTQVQWCELHLAHKDAIHEWAERAKEVEKQLTLRPERVPMTDEQIRSMCKPVWVFETVRQWVHVIEAHHGITAYTKKETT